MQKIETKNNLEFKLDKNSIYNFSSAEINGSYVEIILPMVSMNNSGDALKSYFKYNNKINTQFSAKVYFLHHICAFN